MITVLFDWRIVHMAKRKVKLGIPEYPKFFTQSNEAFKGEESQYFVFNWLIN